MVTLCLRSLQHSNFGYNCFKGGLHSPIFSLLFRVFDFYLLKNQEARSNPYYFMVSESGILSQSPSLTVNTAVARGKLWSSSNASTLSQWLVEHMKYLTISCIGSKLSKFVYLVWTRDFHKLQACPKLPNSWSQPNIYLSWFYSWQIKQSGVNIISATSSSHPPWFNHKLLECNLLHSQKLWSTIYIACEGSCYGLWQGILVLLTESLSK